MKNFLSPTFISFFLLSFGIILFSILSVTSKNIKKAIFYLFFSFFGIAGIYILLFCEFLSILQVTIYVGAILVLLLFASLFIDDKFEDKKNFDFRSFIFSLLFFYFVPLQIIFYAVWGTENSVKEKNFDVTKSIGEGLISQNFFSFELGAFILLLALIGASFMIKNDKGKE